MFGFLKKLKFRSGYSYTAASALNRPKRVVKKAERSVQEIFADGVEFGRSLERDAKRDVKRVAKRRR